MATTEGEEIVIEKRLKKSKMENSYARKSTLEEDEIIKRSDGGKGNEGKGKGWLGTKCHRRYERGLITTGGTNCQEGIRVVGKHQTGLQRMCKKGKAQLSLG